MNRRQFLKFSPFFALIPYLPQSQVYTFGGWFLMSSICPDNGPCDVSCLQYLFFTGSQAQRDAFFGATGEFAGLRGRGWYVFSHPYQLTNEGAISLGELFEERCLELRFPILQKENQ